MNGAFQFGAFQFGAFQEDGSIVFQVGSKGEKYDISLYEIENSFEEYDALAILLLLN